MSVITQKTPLYLGLVRYLVCISTFLMALVGYWLSSNRFDFSNFAAWSAAISIAFAMAFINVLNDIVDIKTDAINYPERPIPSGIISVPEAWSLALFCLIISLILGILAGRLMLLFLLFLLFTGILYDVWASRVPILGKLIVAAWSALTLATGVFVVEGGNIPVVPILAALFFILAREMIETISDSPGDEAAGRRSIYTLLGKTKVLLICLVLTIVAILTLLFPLFTHDLASPFGYLLTVSVLLFLPVVWAAISIWRDQSGPNIRRVAYWVGFVFFSSFIAFLWLV